MSALQFEFLKPDFCQGPKFCRQYFHKQPDAVLLATNLASSTPTVYFLIGEWIAGCRHSTVENTASRAARQPCVNGDRACQWGMAKFDPHPQNSHPLTDHQKTGDQAYIGDPLRPCQIWCKSVHGKLLGKWATYNKIIIFLVDTS